MKTRIPGTNTTSTKKRDSISNENKIFNFFVTLKSYKNMYSVCYKAQNSVDGSRLLVKIV